MGLIWTARQSTRLCITCVYVHGIHTLPIRRTMSRKPSMYPSITSVRTTISLCQASVCNNSTLVSQISRLVLERLNDTQRARTLTRSTHLTITRRSGRQPTLEASTGTDLRPTIRSPLVSAQALILSIAHRSISRSRWSGSRPTLSEPAMLRWKSNS